MFSDPVPASSCCSVRVLPSEEDAQNLFLRHQLSIALRRAPPRLRLRGGDRALLVWMTPLWPGLLGVAQVVQPETILRWHRAGFKTFWRWLPDSEHHEPRNAGSHGPHHRGADRRLRHSVLGAATMPPTRSSLIGGRAGRFGGVKRAPRGNSMGQMGQRVRHG
jgi:hypothetical protein